MKLVAMYLMVLMFSVGSFAQKTTLFVCDEGVISYEEEGDYFFNSRALIYSDEGKTKIKSEDHSEFHIVNKDTIVIPPITPDGDIVLDVIRTTKTEIFIDVMSGEGYIIEIDENKEKSETILSNCSQ